jgi:hypothetical protein
MEAPVYNQQMIVHSYAVQHCWMHSSGRRSVNTEAFASRTHASFSLPVRHCPVSFPMNKECQVASLFTNPSPGHGGLVASFNALSARHAGTALSAQTSVAAMGSVLGTAWTVLCLASAVSPHAQLNGL